MNSSPWPDPPVLGPGEVHLWWVEVGGADGPALAWLSPAERLRAQRFHQERDRRRYVARQAAARRILAAYLGREPGSIAFGEGSHGKPYLAGLGEPGRASGEKARVRFNLSHSEGRVLVAVARDREVGVDVEAVRILPDMERMAAQVFTPFERTVLDGLAPAARPAAFFRGWTRKEAALKALGDGFHREPGTLHVGLAAEDDGRLLFPAQEPALERFALADLAAPHGFAAAVCCEGRDWRTVVACDWKSGLVL